MKHAEIGLHKNPSWITKVLKINQFNQKIDQKKKQEEASVSDNIILLFGDQE